MRIDSFVDTMSRRRYVAGAILGLGVLASPLALHVLHTTYTGTSSVLLVSTDPMHTLVPVADLPVLIQSQAVLDPVRREFSPSVTLDKFRSRVSAKASPRSSVIPISYRDTDKKLAREVPNAIADQSVKVFHDLAGRQYTELTAYLADAAQKERNEIARLDAKLQQVSQNQPFVAASDASTRLAQRLTDLSALRATAYATLVGDQATAHTLASRPAELNAAIRSETLANDPGVQAMRTTTSKDAAQLAQEQAQFNKSYPGLPGLQEQVQAEKASLSAAEQEAMHNGPSSQVYSQSVLDHQRADSAVAADRARLAALDAQVAQARNDMSVLPSHGVNADDLRVRLASAQAAYQAIILRQSQTKADQAQTSSLASLVVIDRVNEAAPRIPAIVLAVLFAIAIMILAVSGALLWDALDNGLRNPSDIEQIYGRPVVGTIGSR